MMRMITAKTEAEFTALVDATTYLAENPVKRESGDQKFEALAFVRWSCDPEARSVSFVANEHVLQAFEVGTPDTATAVIELAKFFEM